MVNKKDKEEQEIYVALSNVTSSFVDFKTHVKDEIDTLSYEINQEIHKFSKLRKALLEQANRINTIERTVGEIEEGVKINNQKINLIYSQLKDIVEKIKEKEQKSIAFKLKTWYNKFVSYFNG